MVQFRWHTFSELTAQQLYAMLALRADIFVVDQNCPYLDPDGKDFRALHLLGMENDNLVVYMRLFPPTEVENYLVFGRVISARSVRGKGYGKQLMQAMLKYCEIHFSNEELKCSAQYHLKGFYESFGLKAYGDIYQEDGIPHIAMCRII